MYWNGIKSKKFNSQTAVSNSFVNSTLSDKIFCQGVTTSCKPISWVSKKFTQLEIQEFETVALHLTFNNGSQIQQVLEKITLKIFGVKMELLQYRTLLTLLATCMPFTLSNSRFTVLLYNIWLEHVTSLLILNYKRIKW